MGKEIKSVHFFFHKKNWRKIYWCDQKSQVGSGVGSTASLLCIIWLFSRFGLLFNLLEAFPKTIFFFAALKIVKKLVYHLGLIKLVKNMRVCAFLSFILSLWTKTKWSKRILKLRLQTSTDGRRPILQAISKLNYFVYFILYVAELYLHKCYIITPPTSYWYRVQIESNWQSNCNVCHGRWKLMINTSDCMWSRSFWKRAKTKTKKIKTKKNGLIMLNEMFVCIEYLNINLYTVEM